MKYKDLNIGDWFSFEGETFIKTYCLPLKTGYDFCLSKKWFGMCFGLCRDEETEVEFISRLTVKNPSPKKEADETLMIAPTLQFLSWQFDNRETIFIKALIKGEIYALALNEDKAGLWMRTNICCIPVKIIPRIDLKYAENI